MDPGSVLALAFAAQALAHDGTAIVVDAARNVEVRYDFSLADVVFSARLPDGWALSVAVDGNQDGRWGLGPRADLPEPRATPDLKFGIDHEGEFCAQYVLSSHPAAPERIFSSSQCGELPSRGTVLVGPREGDGRRAFALRLPMRELFGQRPEAHLQICLWDGRRTHCYQTLARPFVLRRLPVA